jgi:hypothetical protein
LEFCTKIYYVKVSLVKPTVKSGSRGFIQNLFCKFWTFLQVSTNFGSLKQFLLLKTIRKIIKSLPQYWAETGPRLQPTGRGGLPRTVGRKACNAHAGAVTTRRLRARRRGGVLAGGSAVAQRRQDIAEDLEGATGKVSGKEERGTGAPKQRLDGEAGGEFQDSGVHRWGGSSGGRG